MFEAPERVAAVIADFVDECVAGAGRHRDRHRPPAS
jgi:hypothetical protein